MAEHIDWEAMVRALPDYIVLLDRDGRILLINHTAEGFNRDDTIGRSAYDFVPDDFQETVRQALAAAFERGESTRYEVKGAGPNGTISIYESHVRRLELRDGTPVAMVVASDITERRRVEDALRDSEERHREIFENASDGVYTNDLDGRFTYVNAAACKMSGYTRKELIGRNIASIVVKDDVELIKSMRQRKMSRESEATTYELRVVAKGGAIVPLEMSSRLLYRDGKPFAIMGIARDMTELRNLQAQLMLSDRLASLGTLAAGVAHEINNPLTFIQANVSFLGEELRRVADVVGEEDYERLRESLRDARAGADRIARIVRDLTTFSHTDDGDKNLTRVRDILRSTLELASKQLAGRARIETSFREKSLVMASRARLSQAFMNLLLNAAQALPECDEAGNVVRLSTRDAEAGTVVVEVSDTGSGIPPDRLRHIFDPFFTTKPEGVGTGLGLYVAHNIVTELGGRLTVDSEPGRGTTFRATLPAVEPERKPTPPPGLRPPARGDAARILVVDDEELVLRAIKRALPGHDVTTTTSGNEALELLSDKDAFDVVFLDLVMPEIAGIDVYERLKQRSPEIVERIVLMSGGTFTARARNFLESVSNARIAKPFDVRALRELVQERARR